jgi:hypothetical protein
MSHGYNFTEGVRRIPVTAREEASRLNHEYVAVAALVVALRRP